MGTLWAVVERYTYFSFWNAYAMPSESVDAMHCENVPDAVTELQSRPGQVASSFFGNASLPLQRTLDEPPANTAPISGTYKNWTPLKQR